VSDCLFPPVSRSLASRRLPAAAWKSRVVIFALGLIVAFCGSPVWAQTKATESEEPTTAEIMGLQREEPELPPYLDRVVDSDEYYVGPSDRLLINIAGTSPTSFELTISPEATLVFPSIGLVDLRGLTLTEAKHRIIRFLKDFYPKAAMTVTLLEIRRFRVPVVGAVADPGLKTATASTRASELIALAEPQERSSRRGIRLLRGTDTLPVDLARFERLGDRDVNPYVIEGDILQVPVADSLWGWITLSGAVRSPGRLELVAGERISDLLALAQGFTANADTTRIELWRYEYSDSLATRVSWPAGSSYSDWLRVELQPDDHLIVRSLPGYREPSSVEITGAVQRPGVYVFAAERIALTALVDSAGGFTPKADLVHAYVQRTSTPRWMTAMQDRVSQIPTELRSPLESAWIQAQSISAPGRISTDFVQLFEEDDTGYDIMLTSGDRVIVPEQTAYVNVLGRVVQPGFVAYQPGSDLSYYLEHAGGYTWRADRGGTFVVKGGTGAAVKKRSIRSLDPGDFIIVPTKRDRDLWKSFKETLVVAANLATIYLVIDQATR
jgi:protein involved in polysaccharide export with SLBB domain